MQRLRRGCRGPCTRRKRSSLSRAMTIVITGVSLSSLPLQRTCRCRNRCQISRAHSLLQLSQQLQYSGSSLPRSCANGQQCFSSEILQAAQMTSSFISASFLGAVLSAFSRSKSSTFFMFKCPFLQSLQHLLVCHAEGVAVVCGIHD